MKLTKIGSTRIARLGAAMLVGVFTSSFAWLGAVTVTSASEAKPGSKAAVIGERAPKQPASSAREIVVYVSDLPKTTLSEFVIRQDPASRGGKLAVTPNAGGELDPPPEDDPHVTFKVPVVKDVPYRCWIHMKVGAPKGKSQANLFFAQFTGAVDKANKDIYKPGTRSYLSVRGPARPGWIWVGRDLADGASTEPLIHFRATGLITVRLQAGMEGVAFDQFVLSPARFMDHAPVDAFVRN